MVAEPWILKMGNQMSGSLKHALLLENSKKSSSKKQEAKMVAEPWLLKMGNQMSGSLKHALLVENSKKSSSKKQGQQEKTIIGILSFEVANVMSKIIHLHKSLTDIEIIKLKNEILKSEEIKVLVSIDDSMLLEMALVEKLDYLNRVKELGFLVKDMESMVRKMERYVNSTDSLYSEIEVMNELEVATKKFQQNQHEESRKAFEQKLVWQIQDVRRLKDVSLLNRTYDKVVQLLARTVCTVYARICIVFVDAISRRDILNALVSRSQVNFSGSMQRLKQGSGHKSGELDLDQAGQRNASLTNSFSATNSGYYGHSGPSEKDRSEQRMKSDDRLFGPDNLACVMHDDPSSQISGYCSISSGVKREQHILSGYSIHSLNGDPFSGNQRLFKSGLKWREV
ncbi:unnamed protein product [Fraxinus pennsylvanica]|uniref:DUF3475 domain-containing protein n=1 Tax=Fraxinus pennsylvanica TaxID=56036 RepID=A0AAD2DTB0_9LAMI|nr:unnamed protein product [Fraxinus pennsylvanica]